METVDLRTGEEDRSGGSALHPVCTQAAREAGIAHRGGEVLEAVPSYRSLLVLHDPLRTSRERVVERLRSLGYIR
jgi:allophanate hydrolase subunit 1